MYHQLYVMAASTGKSALGLIQEKKVNSNKVDIKIVFFMRTPLINYCIINWVTNKLK